MSELSLKDIAMMIDHSLLNPLLTDNELETGIGIAKAYKVVSICIKPYYVKKAKILLEGTDVITTTVIGFPHGSNCTYTKEAESEKAIEDGAKELDMVVNIGKVLSEDWDYIANDISTVLHTCREHDALLKVIFENCYLKDYHKKKLCEICSNLLVDFVKTSTGFGTGGAIDEDLILMRKYTDSRIRIKAAGKVRTLNRLLEVRALGVSRVGATRTESIMEEAKERFS